MSDRTPPPTEADRRAAFLSGMLDLLYDEHALSNQIKALRDHRDLMLSAHRAGYPDAERLAAAANDYQRVAAVAARLAEQMLDLAQLIAPSSSTTGSTSSSTSSSTTTLPSNVINMVTTASEEDPRS